MDLLGALKKIWISLLLNLLGIQECNNMESEAVLTSLGTSVMISIFVVSI